MSQTGEAEQFISGSILLSRTSKATIGEKGYLYLETEMDYLTLDVAEAARLADFLRDQHAYPKAVERLEQLTEYVLAGQATRAAAETRLYEIMVTFLPTSLLVLVRTLYAALNQNKQEENS